MHNSDPTHVSLRQRGFKELQGVLVELAEEGSALGLTPAELFLQFGDPACADGIGSRELRKGLASLSVHLTEAEIETVLAGAGCTGSRPLLTSERFSALVQSPAAAAAAAAAATDAAAAGAADLDTQHNPPRARLDRDEPRKDGDGADSDTAGDDGGYVSPDSLAPRMSLSELLVDVRDAGGGDGDGPGTSSSAAAHVEAFGRVAAGVQAVLTTAISGSGTEQTGAESGSGRGGGDAVATNTPGERAPGTSRASSRRRSPDRNSSISGTPASRLSSSSAAKTSTGRSRFVGAKTAAGGVEQHHHQQQQQQQQQQEEEKEEEEEEGQEKPAAQTPSRRRSAAASRSGPVPRAGAITPPLGPARSPSEPLHPTRASRERLEAALEGLDLKERLRPTATVGGDGDGNGDRRDRGENTPGFPRVPSRSYGGGRAGDRSAAERAGGELMSLASPRSASVGAGDGDGRNRRVPFSRAPVVAGVDDRGARIRRFSGRRSGRAVSKQRGCSLGEVVDLATAGGGDHRAAYDGGPEGAPEEIGRLRARVAELELSEQVCVVLDMLGFYLFRGAGMLRT